MNQTTRFNLLLVLSILAASAALWNGLRTNEDREIAERLQAKASVYASLVSQRMELQERALARLAKRWEFVGGTPRREWEEDVRVYVQQSSEIQAIEWVDPSYHVRWIVPYEGNEAAQDLNLAFEPSRREAIETARVRRSTLLTAPIDLVQGGKGFLLLIPVFLDGSRAPERVEAPTGADGFDGFVLGVFRFEEMIGSIDLPAGIELVISDGEARMIGKRAEETDPRFGADARIDLYGRVWKIHIEPTAGYLAAARSGIPASTAAGVLVLSIVVLCLANLAKALRTAGRRAEQERDRANRAAATKSSFIATVSHEIRTPMNGVVGAADLLRQTTLDGEQRELVRILGDSSRILLSIINEVLDFSKLEADRVELNRISTQPRELARRVSRVILPQAEAKGIEFRVEGLENLPAALFLDPVRVAQVMVNLAGNAVKFTSRGHVTVRFDHVQSAAILKIEVEDTGIGMPNVADIFGEFTQVDSGTTRMFGGTGLGLAISKRLCELMRAKIDVESTPGEGSTFTLSIPAEACAPGDRESDAPDSARFVAEPSACVLVVDDNAVNRMVAEKSLSRMGFDVDTASDGEFAVEAVSARDYTAILMDCRMPGMDGYEATRRIRAAEVGERVPIIAMTANTQPDDRRRCLEAGMDDFLSKPVTFDALRQNLAYWIGKGASKPPR